MSTEQTYNGWSNYATWRVNLELIDDHVSSFVGETEVWRDVDECAEALQQFVDECLTNFGDIPDDSLAISYAQAFTSDVDYREIAETILADNPELFTTEEEDEDHPIESTIAARIDRDRDDMDWERTSNV